MKNVLVVILILMFVAVAFINVSFAVESVAPGKDSLMTAVNNVLINTVAPLFVALIGGLVSMILAVVKKKLNIQLSVQTEAWIQSQAEHACQMVAEKAAAQLKISGLKLQGHEMLGMAAAALISRVPALTQDKAEEYIHAAFARIPGLGATGDASLIPGAAVALKPLVGFAAGTCEGTGIG